MIKASVVSIGNEILSGQTIDTNAAYLSRELLSVGIPVVSSYTAGDDVEAISRAIHYAYSDADLILVTGGLGPTDDDVTRQALARFLGVELEFREELLDQIKEFFANRDREMTGKNKVQAYIPAGAQSLANRVGTAPGILSETQDKLIAVLPGVPSEMKKMLEDSLMPKLKQLAGGQVVLVRKLKCFGEGESNIAQMLGSIMERGRNPQVNCTVHGGVITLHIVAQAGNRGIAERMLERDEKTLREVLGALVFGRDEQTLADVVGKKLTMQGKTVAVVESCTGGLLAKMLTDTPGASSYFIQGWVTYTDSSKTSELGVAPGLIKQHGAVSEQVACAMAEGARRKAATDFAIGITGIAGPTGATEHKPVGLVYISVVSGSDCLTSRNVFSHGRSAVRLRAALTALDMLRLQLGA